ncbi:MAG TPA: methylated-DNA--[protein]-cysteine S-methyltransferase [Streptosporangiaceae bacterium]
MTSLEWTVLDTPVGPVSVGCGDAGVAHVRFGRPPAGARTGTAPAVAGTPAVAGAPDGAEAPDETRPADGTRPPDVTRPPPGTAAPGESAAPKGVRGPEEARAGQATGPPAAGPDSRRELADAARRQLAEYFCGERKTFDLPLDWSGFAPGQLKVLGRLFADVGWGQTVTYGKLAGLTGIPASEDVIPARAVGQIMGSNPIPVIVPCHRVVASDGIGGYSGGAGPEVKRWLLILEGSMPPTLDWTPASPPGD